MTSLTAVIVKILHVTLFRKLVLAFRKLTKTLKVVPKAACDPEIVSKATNKCTCEKNIERKGSREQSLELLSAYKEASRKIIFSFLFNPHQNDQGRKGPCFFQRLIALKCLKLQKIKKNI
jgi:hypothetical protein